MHWLQAHVATGEQLERVEIGIAAFEAEVQADPGETVGANRLQYSERFTGLDVLTSHNASEHRLVRRPEPAVVDDDDTATCHRSGEGDAPRADSEDRLPSGTQQVNATVSRMPREIRRGEDRDHHGSRLERPHPRRVSDGSGRRAHRQQYGEHGRCGGESTEGHVSSVP